LFNKWVDKRKINLLTTYISVVTHVQAR